MLAELNAASSSRDVAADRADVRCALKRWVIVLALFILSALPVIGPLAPETQAHDLARICQLFIFAVAAAAALAVLGLRPICVNTAMRGPPAAVLVVLAWVAGASVMHASHLQPALLELSIFGSMVLLAAAFSTMFDETDRAGMALVVPTVASGVLSFMILVRYSASVGSDASILREHLIPGYSNYRFFNHVQVVTIPLIAAFAGRIDLSPRFRALAYGVLSFEFCWLAFTGGRATMLALAVGVGVVVLLYRSRSTRWLQAFGVSAVAGIVLYVLLFAAVQSLLGVAGDYTALDTVERSAAETGQIRRLLWGLALQYIAESLWVGIGPMHFAHRVNSEAAHPHNIYLQIAAEWGLPMLAIVLVLAGLGMRRLIRATRRSENGDDATLGVGLTAACVAIAVDGMFSGNFVMPNSQLWIAFSLGLAAAYVIRIEGRNAPAMLLASGGRTVDLRWPIAVAIVLSQVALWHGVWPEILDVSAHVDRVRAEVVTNWRDNPRFWSHGWIR